MNLGKENETTEFKTSTNELDEAMDDICAILNKHSSGILYFGVRNNGEVCGFSVGADTERDISRRIYESILPQIYPTITPCHDGEKQFVSVEFSGIDKPYSSFGRYYTRTADESREMNPQELARFILRQNYSLWENMKSDCGVDDIDEVSLKAFLAKAIECQRMQPMVYEKTALLEKLGLLSSNPKFVTNAGKLLFSSKGPIRLKMGVFASNEKRTFIDASPIDGNIFSLIGEGEKYIKKNIHYSIVINGFERTDVPEIPETAIREIITNSFAHADYLASSQHEIDIFPNRVAIYNPGPFPDDYTPEDFIEKTLSSKIVNVKICDVLFKCKAIESWGTGLRNAYNACAKQGVGFSYEREQDGFWVLFTRKSGTDSVPDYGTDNLRQSIASGGAFSEFEKLVLEEIRKNVHVDRSTLAKTTGRSTRSIQRTLDALKKKNAIKRVGPAHGGYWEVLK